MRAGAELAHRYLSARRARRPGAQLKANKRALGCRKEAARRRQRRRRPIEGHGRCRFLAEAVCCCSGSRLAVVMRPARPTRPLGGCRRPVGEQVGGSAEASARPLPAAGCGLALALWIQLWSQRELWSRNRLLVTTQHAAGRPKPDPSSQTAPLAGLELLNPAQWAGKLAPPARLRSAGRLQILTCAGRRPASSESAGCRLPRASSRQPAACSQQPRAQSRRMQSSARSPPRVNGRDIVQVQPPARARTQSQSQSRTHKA